MKPNFLEITIACSLLLLFSCGYLNNEEYKDAEVTNKPFEGKITLSESRGLYGEVMKIHTTYWISKDVIRREQKMGGINAPFGAYAGIIFNMKTDSITLYNVEKILNKRVKHTMSLADCKEKFKNKPFPYALPSPVDQTFQLLYSQERFKHVKDSMEVKGLLSDYTLFKDSIFTKLEVFDSKKIKLQRDILELMFTDLPKSINFPLKTEMQTTISDVSNDSIISGKTTKDLDRFVRSLIRLQDTTVKESSNLEKLAKNKWVNMGVNLLKKGVDLTIHGTSIVSEFSSEGISATDFSLPSGDFIEVDDFDEFLIDLSKPGGGDWD